MAQDNNGRDNLGFIGDLLYKYLCDVLYAPLKAHLDISSLPEELHAFASGLQFFAECVIEVNNLAKSLSKGDVLRAKLPSRENEMASPLKSLHSSLSHLTWQTMQIAKGDYGQRVEFMGEFADSFNVMVEQLKERRDALNVEIKNGQEKAKALEQSNSLFEAVTACLHQLIAVVDIETPQEWLFLNHPVEQFLKKRKFMPYVFKWITEQVERNEGLDSPSSTELDLSDAEKPQYISVERYPLRWYGRDAAVFVLADITLEKIRYSQLEAYAYRDALTGAYNRHYGMEILNKWISEGLSFLICFIDIDYLKYVNDAYGHEAGDSYILLTTETLGAFTKDMMIFRLGGDEFMLLLRDWELKAAEERLEEIRTKLREQKASPSAINPYSISYGVVSVDKNNTLPPSKLLANADEKMYEYKRAHKVSRLGDAAKI
ncbi:hypothetical protein FACS1894187_18390 [Synergistales bacterium]|nr:hypothetical protein FACS1894187_18390 [Synergistales bacterium]